jgi:hypothetical protein
MCRGWERLTQGTEMASDTANLFCEYLVIEPGLKLALPSYYKELERLDLKMKRRGLGNPKKPPEEKVADITYHQFE